MNRIYIQTSSGPTVADMDVEIVERKGLGHPDTICDAVMERVSQALSRVYLEKFGFLPHFNCDKGLLVAGQVERRFGGGRVVEPMRLVIGDRATSTWEDKHLDVAEIAVESAKAWFRENLPHINPDRHLHYQVELKPGSEELTGLFHGNKSVMEANDTSAAVGYAPLSETERLVLDTEHHLNSSEFKASFPETGQDVKVMGVRISRSLALTVAVPLIDRYLQNEAEYFERKQAVHRALLAYLQARLENLEEVRISLNTLDRPGTGTAGMYLSVLGTSAEDADSGEVGRGNQVNGLIALNRPRGSEAAAGKNPVSHVGKIYNVFTHLLADRIYKQVSGLREVEVWLCSRIGDPVNQPQIVSVQVHLHPGITLKDITLPLQQVVEEELSKIPIFCQELIQGRYPVC
jgi:S-adenosylmethionine synthetase